MLISVEKKVPTKAAPEAGAPKISGERRKNSRHNATYRPCCLIRGKRATMALLRNFSADGACIETNLDLEVNETIIYFWEAKLNITARVAWRDGKLFGLEHIAEVEPEEAGFPARSVRVPCTADAVCWIEGNRHRASIENVSLGGIRLHGLPEMKFGTLMTICFCGIEIEAATARWSKDGSIGVRFKERLSRNQLAELLLNEKLGFTSIGFEI